jgi:hypothetical protein
MYNQRFCCTCGEETNAAHVCEYSDREPQWCEDCGAELTDIGTCLNDHDETGLFNERPSEGV